MLIFSIFASKYFSKSYLIFKNHTPHYTFKYQAYPLYLVMRMKGKLVLGIIAILAILGIAVISGMHVHTGAALLDDQSNAQTQDGHAPDLDYDFVMIYHAQLLDGHAPELDYDFV